MRTPPRNILIFDQESEIMLTRVRAEESPFFGPTKEIKRAACSFVDLPQVDHFFVATVLQRQTKSRDEQ